MVRVLAEHPWGLVFPLLVAGAGLAWFGSRTDRVRLVIGGVGVLLLAASLLVGAALWRSPGEQAADAVRALVAAAERADVPAVEAAFSADATIHYGAPQAPGYDMREILRAAQALRGRHRIESNSVTELAFATVNTDLAEVVLGCRTTTQSSFGPVPNRWWMELRRQADGRWLVERMAFLQVGTQRPGRGAL